jgi:magnesium-transporting ATPase (P-type)
MIVFALQVLGQISMILSLSGEFNSTIGYSFNGGFDVNKQKYNEENAFIKITPETNILFLFTNFMYIFTLIAFTIGRPWKKPFYTNKPFMVVLILSLTYSILIVILPQARLAVFQVKYLDSGNINGFVLGVALGFGIFIFILEKAIL